MSEKTFVDKDGARYYADKPSNCRYCFWWKNNEKACLLGKENCYYLAEEIKGGLTPCDGCPYGKYRVCIGFCTKHILGLIEEVPYGKHTPG